MLTLCTGRRSRFSVVCPDENIRDSIKSGLFLLGERPFSVGNIIKLGSSTGEVLSIDLLSVKLRTFDNLYVRILTASFIITKSRKNDTAVTLWL